MTKAATKSDSQNNSYTFVQFGENLYRSNRRADTKTFLKGIASKSAES
jgi:hypothetical protein